MDEQSTGEDFEYLSSRRNGKQQRARQYLMTQLREQTFEEHGFDPERLIETVIELRQQKLTAMNDAITDPENRPHLAAVWLDGHEAGRRGTSASTNPYGKCDCPLPHPAQEENP